jgi:hypothetical protein
MIKENSMTVPYMPLMSHVRNLDRERQQLWEPSRMLELLAL